VSTSDATQAESATTEVDDPARGDARRSDQFVALLDAAFRDVDDQVLVTQGRCVDHLLDLFNATRNAILRRLIVRALENIRPLRVVRAEDIHTALCVLEAAANVEFAGAEAAASED
jgi:hypothetical protein